MDFEPLNPILSQNFPYTPQFSPSLGKKCEILEVSGSVKVIFIHGKVNKRMWFLRISSLYVRIRHWNFSTVPQNSPRLGEKVYILEKPEVSRRFYFCTGKLTCTCYMFEYFKVQTFFKNYQVHKFDPHRNWSFP